MLRMLAVARGGGTFTPTLTFPNAATILSDLSGLYATNAFAVTVGSEEVATGFKPANGEYNSLYTRDNAYVLWHYPEVTTAAARREFATYVLSRRTTGAEADPDGGTLEANYPPDRINADGTAFYKNSDNPNGDLPLLDSIHFVILALWADWNAEGDTTTFDSVESDLATCLAVIPRAANGCVTFVNPSIDYGFTDRCEKSGDVAYGTALQAWTYKMMAEMAGESGSGTYTTLREEAQDGLATLRKVSGWYAGDSEDNADVDDVWATALIVAEELVSGADRTASATTIRDAYLAGDITQNGLIRHFGPGQGWNGYTYSVGATFQNGGYWMTPLWDCYRAVQVVDAVTAHAWVQEVLDEVGSEIATSGASLAPYEWRNGATISVPKGYTCHAALIRRFV